MTREQAEQICERVLSFVTADEATATVTEATEGATRFANSEITQNVANTDTTLDIRVAFENRVGGAGVNAFDDDTLRSAVSRAEEMAKVAAPDTEFVPCPGPSDVPASDGYDEATSQASPEVRAKGIREAIAKADEAGVSLAGSSTTRALTVAAANTKGAFHHYPSTFARFVCTAMTGSSSGWAEGVSHEMGSLDPASLAARAASKANAGRDPVDVEPGDWTVVFEPPAVADLLVFVGFSLEAKAAIEGRSVFSGKESTQLAGPSIRLTSDPAHPTCPARPFDDDLSPLGRVDWIKDGALNTLSYDRFWAKKADRPFTGSPTNLIMAGGAASDEDLIAKVDRGLLVTRLWYIRHVDPMQLLLTGMTRDGLFLIEGGKVTKGVKNLRFNESPLVMLKNVEALGRPKRCGAWMSVEAPSALVREYTFTSGTSF